MARVLVVEPDRQVRRFIAGILSDLGHNVRQCAGASDVRLCLKHGKFDVLATDLAIAPMAGAALPMLTLSGRPYPPAAGPCERPAGLRDKPFRFDDLRLLAAAVGQSAAPAALAA